MNPRVSILVAAYNAEAFIAETIDSVLAQTFADWELIVCDDGSVDATSAIVESFAAGDARIKLVRQANAGAAVARNVAYARSSGEYVVILDADDRLLPDKLRLQTRLLDDNPEAGVVYGDTWFCDPDGRRVQLESERYPGQHRQGDVFVALCCGNMMAVHAAMVRRAAIEAVGGVHDPARLQIADWDLWVRIAADYPFVCHPEAVADYRLHPTMSARRDSVRMKVRQLEFNLSRMEGLRRFATLSRRDKSRIYFAHGRCCARWKAVSSALGFYLRALADDPLNGRVYPAVIALLFRK
jgi:glycosyltransferase involved in cell wall biosynthesis